MITTQATRIMSGTQVALLIIDVEAHCGNEQYSVSTAYERCANRAGNERYSGGSAHWSSRQLLRKKGHLSRHLSEKWPNMTRLEKQTEVSCEKGYRNSALSARKKKRNDPTCRGGTSWDR